MNPKSIKSKFTYKFLKSLKSLCHNKNNNIRHDHRAVKRASDWSLASAVGPKRAWSMAVLRRVRRRRIRRSREGNRVGDRKIDELRGLVPGGEEMDMCKLLSETAHYIKCLNMQVKVMENIADLYST